MNSLILKLCLSILVIFLGSCQGTPLIEQSPRTDFKPNQVQPPPSLGGLDSLTTGEEKRVALVIGNADYRFLPLNNPENDARDMANVLRGLGFQVIHRENAGQQAMESAIREFGQQLGSRTVGLFYFSGHGIQYEGENYLIPTGMPMPSVADLKYKSVAAGYVLTTMEAANNALNIIIFDACRDNLKGMSSFKGTTKTKGLAHLDNVPSGSLIAYATSPGKVAIDGYGRNSPYTEHLLKFIQQPGLPIELMFKKVRNAVRGGTNGQQTPWESSSLYGEDFYFAGKVEPTKRKAEAATQLITATSSRRFKSRHDFFSDKEYGKYTQATLQKGMRVKAIKNHDRVTKGMTGTYYGTNSRWDSSWIFVIWDKDLHNNGDWLENVGAPTSKRSHAQWVHWDEVAILAD